MKFIQQMGVWAILVLSSMAAAAQGVNSSAETRPVLVLITQN